MEKLIRYTHGWEKINNIKRYGDHCVDNGCGDCGLCGPMDEDPNGIWVKFEDVEKILKQSKEADGV